MMARRTSFACCAMLICSCSFAEAFNSAYMSVPSVRFRGSFPQLLHTGRVRPCLTTRMADEGGILSKVSLPSLTQVETVDYDHPAHIPVCPVSGCAKGLFCEQICYGALLYTSAQGLLSDALVGSFDRPVILDSFIFVVSLVLLRQTFAKVNYAKLDGLEVNSLARDAGDWALAGAPAFRWGHHYTHFFFELDARPPHRLPPPRIFSPLRAPSDQVHYPRPPLARSPRGLPALWRRRQPKHPRLESVRERKGQVFVLRKK